MIALVPDKVGLVAGRLVPIGRTMQLVEPVRRTRLVVGRTIVVADRKRLVVVVRTMQFVELVQRRTVVAGRMMRLVGQVRRMRPVADRTIAAAGRMIVVGLVQGMLVVGLVLGSSQRPPRSSSCCSWPPLVRPHTIAPLVRTIAGLPVGMIDQRSVVGRKIVAVDRTIEPLVAPARRTIVVGPSMIAEREPSRLLAELERRMIVVGLGRMIVVRLVLPGTTGLSMGPSSSSRLIGLERSFVVLRLSSSSRLLGLGPRMQLRLLGTIVQQVRRMRLAVELERRTIVVAARTIVAGALEPRRPVVAGLEPRRPVVELVPLGTIGLRPERTIGSSSLSTMGSLVESAASKPVEQRKLAGVAPSSLSRQRQVRRLLGTTTNVVGRTIVVQLVQLGMIAGQLGQRKPVAVGHMTVAGVGQCTIAVRQVQLGTIVELMGRCSSSSRLIVAGRLEQLVARSSVVGSSIGLGPHMSSAGRRLVRTSFGLARPSSLIGQPVQPSMS